MPAEGLLAAVRNSEACLAIATYSKGSQDQYCPIQQESALLLVDQVPFVALDWRTRLLVLDSITAARAQAPYFASTEEKHCSAGATGRVWLECDSRDR